MVGSGLALATDAANLAAEASGNHVWVIVAWVLFAVACLVTLIGIKAWR